MAHVCFITLACIIHFPGAHISVVSVCVSGGGGGVTSLNYYVRNFGISGLYTYKTV